MIAHRILRDDERRAWLRLARTETIGPTTFAALIARFGDVRQALDAASRAKGANRLIREGATPTESADDVLAVLRPILGHGFREPSDGGSPPPPAESPPEREIDRVRAIVEEEEKHGPALVEVDELIRQCRASPAAVLTVLLKLELAGLAQRHPGNRLAWR